MLRIAVFIQCLFYVHIVITAQILTSSNLPIIVINTDDEEIPDEPRIFSTMGIIYNGESQINNFDENFNYYNGYVGIETRGNSTQGFEKKTYTIELKTDQEEDLSVDLFRMGADEDWILHAMVIDKTQIRIPMSFYLAQRMGQYASEWKYVELVINDEYQGLYILVEKIKRDNDRVDIAKLDEDDIAGDSLTGGYILRLDWLDDARGFESNFDSQGGRALFFQWHYPKADNIKEAQEAYISDWMFEYESALFSNDFFNASGVRYTDYIDLNSFVDFLLINELSKNSDGYKLSTYMHKDRESKGGKLIAGPIWDFDQTYGASRVCSNDDFEGWTYLQNQEDCEDLESMPMWWRAMMEDTVFQNRLACRWSAFRSTFLHLDSLGNWIDTQVDFIAEPILRNFERYDYIIGESIWIEPDPIPQTYEAEVDYLKTWIENRLNWLDENMVGNCENDINTSIADLKLDQVEVFPNPVKELLYVKDAVGFDIELLDNIGKVIYSHNVTEKLHSIDTSELASGLYFLKYGSTNWTKSKRVILQ